MFRKPTLLDSSTLINVMASKHARSILEVFGGQARICGAVRVEALFLRSEAPGEAPEHILLEPLLEEGFLKHVDLAGPEEEALYVEFAADLDDGEAMTLAIAHQRGMAVATDDRKARRLAEQRVVPPLELLRTSEIIHRWAHEKNIPREDLRTVLSRIESTARFTPPNDDPLRGWWLELLRTETGEE